MSDALDFAKKALPWLAAAASGNVPVLVALAADVVGKATGTTVEATKEAVATAIAGASQEDLVVMKVEENNFALKMQELGYKKYTDLVAADNADRDSARKREMVVKDSTTKYLAYFIAIIWAALNCVLLTKAIPTGSEQLVARLLGTLDAALMAVLYYYFGSSQSSAIKTDALNVIASKSNNRE